MAYRKSVEKRLDKKEKFESEQLMKVKRSEEYEALEEVFDVNERIQRCQT